MKAESKTLTIFIIVGIVVGYLSFLLNNNYASILLALIVLIAMSEVLKKVLKINEQLKWFLTNGGWVYIFAWFISWVIFYNLFYASVV